MDREELFAREEAAWQKLRAALSGLSTEQLHTPTLNPEGWAPKDLMFHIGGWLAEAGRQLERMAAGTFTEPDFDVDGINHEWFELSRRLDLDSVEAELASARARMLAEFAALPEVTPSAQEWFEESGEVHYTEHLRELRSWIAAVG
jgi:Mycothiol maleylpyruvate isomerase N-terminal domain